MRSLVSAERAWKDHKIRKFTALIFFQVVWVSCTISINGNLLSNILVCCTFCAYFCLFNLLQLVILLCCTDQKSFEGCIIANLVSNNRVSYVTPQKCDYLFVCLNIFYIFNFPCYSICGIQIITSFLWFLCYPIARKSSYISNCFSCRVEFLKIVITGKIFFIMGYIYTIFPTDLSFSFVYF